VALVNMIEHEKGTGNSHCWCYRCGGRDKDEVDRTWQREALSTSWVSATDSTCSDTVQLPYQPAVPTSSIDRWIHQSNQSRNRSI